MSAVPLIHMSQFRPIMELLDGIGAPIYHLLEAAKLPNSVYDNPVHFTCAPSAWSFLASAAQSQGVPDLGWRAIEATGFQDLGSWASRAARASTLRDAIHALAYWYQKEVPIVRTGLGDGGDHAWLWRSRLVGLQRHSGDEVAEQFTLGRLIRTVRLAGGTDWIPVHVKLEHSRDESRLPPEALPGAKIEYDQSVIAVAVPWDMLDLPLSAPPLAQSTSSIAAESPDPCRDFAGSLRQVLTPLISERRVTLPLAAEIAGMSERSLRRHLTDDGSSWRQIIDQLHFGACRPLIEDASIPISEVAQMLGYSDHAHFTRAFQRWTGQTPSGFRRRAQKGLLH